MGVISIAKRPGILVPASALRRSMVGEDEVVVCDAGTAHVHKVEIGNRSERGIEIKDGLKAGEQVVVDHVLGLQDGQALTAPEGSAAKGAAKEGATKEGATKEGAAKEGAAKEGAAKEGATKEGATKEGAAEGSAAKGSAAK